MFSVQNDLILAVIGREEIQNVMDMYSNIIHNISLISITDPDRSNLPRCIVSEFKNALEISFWDIEENFCNYEIITPEQGSTIKNFIDENELFLVHCEAGISRSAGVAKAIECIKWHNSDKYYASTNVPEDSIRNHTRYSPNNTVFDTVIGE